MKKGHFCGYVFRISMNSSGKNSPEMGGKKCPEEGRIQALRGIKAINYMPYIGAKKKTDVTFLHIQQIF